MDDKYLKPVVTGAVIGAIATLMLGAMSHLPPSVAAAEPMHTLTSTMDELLPRGFDPNSLVRFSDAAYTITADPGISRTPLSTTTVRKIGFGKLTLVAITTTASGVYSSDAMTSPYVRYPGIHATRVYPAARDGDDSVAYWSPHRGWIASPRLNAGSFVTVAPFKGGAVVVGPQGTCVLTKYVASC
jgi:hypothetical protein